MLTEFIYEAHNVHFHFWDIILWAWWDHELCNREHWAASIWSVHHGHTRSPMLCVHWYEWLIIHWCLIKQPISIKNFTFSGSFNRLMKVETFKRDLWNIIVNQIIRFEKRDWIATCNTNCNPLLMNYKNQYSSLFSKMHGWVWS